jgi:hypothetical protein
VTRPPSGTRASFSAWSIAATSARVEGGAPAVPTVWWTSTYFEAT